ncbi:MAG: PLP-dependent transferase [Bryobacteraceae bacterium]
MKFETRAIHAGRHIDPLTKAVAQPIHLSSTFQRDADGQFASGFSYSRDDNPNRKALEQCLTSLEGGKEALAFSSGLAVATAVFQGLEPGDHIIVPDDTYWALRKVIGDVFGKAGLATEYVDMTNLDRAPLPVFGFEIVSSYTVYILTDFSGSRRCHHPNDK